MFETTQYPKNNHKHPNQHHVKKRHWCLGAAVILVGSWITHTTTATIADGSQQERELAFVTLPDRSAIAAAENPAAPDEPSSVNPETRQPAAAPEPTLTSTFHTIRKGESIGTIFKKLGLDRSLPYKIGQHETAGELTSLAIGRELTFKSDENGVLRKIHYPTNALQEMVVHFEDSEIVDAGVIDLPYTKIQHTVSGEIHSSLYEAALEAGLSNALIMEMVRIFGWDIDFVLDIRAGDTFHIIYEDYRLDGRKLADGDILAAEFTTQNQTYRAIRFTDSEGAVSYYTPQGESMLGTFLRSPVEFSRITSRFGKRKHPILKTWRAHNGVDYAASRGTPVRATADGMVSLAGNNGGYGRTIVIRHAGRFSTLYAHMTGFAKGIRSGSRVKQGDIIGYVGSTGLATGPHLHYEFRVDGVHRNPLTYKTPKSSSVEEALQDEFKNHADQWGSKLDQVSRSFQLAKNGAKSALTPAL